VDMLGNILEWVDTDGVTESGTQVERRGGSWGSIEVYLHAAWRNYASPDDTRSSVGFRCAVDYIE
jgi:formylglycine-generating enzyme required for sulfatase activity